MSYFSSRPFPTSFAMKFEREKTQKNGAKMKRSIVFFLEKKDGRRFELWSGNEVEEEKKGGVV